MKDLTVKSRFVELRAAGRSYADIAAELKVSKQTLITWSRSLQLEIGNLKAIEVDALQRRLKIHAEARLELLGGVLERLRDEFFKRDLGGLPTDKLIDQIAKISSALQVAVDAKPETFGEDYIVHMSEVGLSADTVSGTSRWPV